MRETLFSRAGGLGRAAALLNVVLIGALPFTWMLPLLKNSAFWVLSSEITILWGAIELMSEDLFLALVVAVFAMLIPFAKAVLYAFIWFGTDGRNKRLSWAGTVMAKLSMTDVFLFALIILAVKGLSIGKVEPQYGLYVFSSVVLASVFVSIVTAKAMQD